MTALLVRVLNWPPRSRRILASTIFIGMMLIVLILSIQFFSIIRAEIAEVTNKRELLGQQAAALKSMKAAVESGRRNTTLLKDAFLQGNSEAVAEAAIQSWMSDTAGQIGIEVNTLSGAEPFDDGDLRLIGIRTSVTGTYERILQLLAAVDMAKPRLTVVRGEFQSSNDEMMDANQTEPLVTANLTIMGTPAPGAKGTVDQ